MEYNTQINPLIEDLKKLNLIDFLKSSSFERVLVKHKADTLWQQLSLNAEVETYMFRITDKKDEASIEYTFRKLINTLFTKYEDSFYEFLTNTLTNIKKYKGEPIDLSEIIEDIELLSPSKETLEALKQLGQDYNEPTKVSMETSEKKEYRSVSDTNLLPGFEFKNINGAINPRNISFRLDKNKDRRHRTNELKESILNYLKVPQLNKETWERHRDNFFDEIDQLNN